MRKFQVESCFIVQTDTAKHNFLGKVGVTIGRVIIMEFHSWDSDSLIIDGTGASFNDFMDIH